MSSYTSYPSSLRTWSSASISPPQWDLRSGESSTTPESTTSSSVASSYFDPFNDHRYDHRVGQQQQQQSPSETFVEGLMRIQKEKTHETGEWKWKCNQLEQTVSRLMHQVEVLKKERDDLRLESIATGTANLVFGVDDENSTSHTTSTPCRWDGRTWVPVVPLTSNKPQIDPTKSMSKQNPPPCNAYYLLGECEVPRCRFCHNYDLTENQINEMRRGAKFHLCNAIQNGVDCPDGAKCIYGHHCPRGPTCSRQHCAFNDDQHRVVPTPRPTLRRRPSFGVAVQQQQQQQQQLSQISQIQQLSSRRF
ncbi:hypothetical protein JCM5353_008864 [Sporobolomyces roseus]